MPSILYRSAVVVLCGLIGETMMANTPAKAAALARWIAKDSKYEEPQPDPLDVIAAIRKNEELSRLSAANQRTQLWNLIEKSQYKPPLPTESKAGALQSLHMLNDTSFLVRIFERSFAPFVHSKFLKYTHAYGTVAQITFIPTQQIRTIEDENTGTRQPPYSGLFSKTTIGLLRLSQITIGSLGSVNPSSALHLFVDQSQMVSIVGMPSIDGQPNDSNFFLNPFTSIPGPANQEPASLIIDTFISTILTKLHGFRGTVMDRGYGKRLTALSLIEPASILPHGAFVPKGEVQAPFEISLEAPSQVIQKYEKVKDSGDFRDLIAQNFKSGSIIFEVYGRDKEDAIAVWDQRWVNTVNSKNYYKTGRMIGLNRKRLIGVVQLTSDFISSEAGDLIRARHTK